MGGPNRRKPYEQRVGPSANAREDTTDTLEIVRQLNTLLTELSAPPSKYTPPKVAAQVTELEQGADTLPFYSLVGHTELTPYFWIILEDKIIPPELDFLNPLRKNIKSISLKNEYGKFPTVEFEVYVPEFRQLSSTVTIGDTAVKSDPGKVIDYFKLGKSFRVRWGYVSNHTEWKGFRVIDRQVTFEDGTALLTVKGRFGSRLSATITSEVFSASYGKTAIDQIASLVDMKTDYRQTLDEEYDRLFDENQVVTMSGKNLAIGSYLLSKRANIEMYLDPIDNVMRFTTPFAYELIRRGVKPYKMTYGYPTSNISTIDIETKYPKKKGKGVRKATPLGQKPGATAIVDEKEGEAVFVVAGPIRYKTPEGEKELIVGNFLQYAFYSVEPNTSSFNDSIGLAKAEEKYPSEQGFKVSFVKRNVDPNYGEYLIQRIVTLPKNLTKETKTVSKADYSLLLAEQAQGKKFLSLNDNVETGINQLNVTIYTKGSPLSDSDKKTENKSEAKEEALSTTTIEATPKEDQDTSEDEDTLEDKWVMVDGTFSSINNDLYEYNKNKTGILANQDVDNFTKTLQSLEQQAKDKGDDYKLKIEETNGLKIAYLQQRTQVPVRKDPSKSTEQTKEEKPSSESASPDASTPEPNFKPVSQQSGLPSGTSRLKTTKVRVKLKAGDWTMRVGRIIEIIDIHNSLNGFYYIFSEEHIISNDGFHTEFECRKASKKAVNLYGKGQIRRKGGKVEPKGGTRKPKSGEEAEVKSATEKDTPKTVIRDIDAEREKTTSLNNQKAEQEKQRNLELQRAEAYKYASNKRTSVLNRTL